MGRRRPAHFGALQFENRAAAALVDSLSVSMIAVDHDATILHVNEVAESILIRPGSGLQSRKGRLLCAGIEDTAVLRRLIGYRSDIGRRAERAEPASPRLSMLQIRQSFCFELDDDQDFKFHA